MTTRQKKFRIAFIAEDYPPNQGGIAEYSHNLATALAGQGHDVRVVSAHVTGDRECDAGSAVPVSRIGERDIRRKSLGLWARRKAVGAFQQGLDDWMASEYPRKGPDFAIVSSLSVWARVCRRQAVPYAVCIHGGDAFGKRSDFLRSLYRKRLVRQVLHEARHIFTNSDFTRSQVLALGGLGGKVTTTYCGVSGEFIEAVSQRQVGESSGGTGQRLLMMCRLVPIKACDVVLEAVAMLREKYPGLHLSVAGDGPEREALESLAGGLGIADRVDFLGYVGDLASKVELFCRSDILVQSGRLDPHEGRPEAFGIVFAEAGVCARPVIGPRLGGVPEVIRDGETGCLVEPDSVTDLVQVLDKMLSSPDQARQMGVSGKQWVGGKFSYVNIANEIVSVMSEGIRK